MCAHDLKQVSAHFHNGKHLSHVPCQDRIHGPRDSLTLRKMGSRWGGEGTLGKHRHRTEPILGIQRRWQRPFLRQLLGKESRTGGGGGSKRLCATGGLASCPGDMKSPVCGTGTPRQTYTMEVAAAPSAQEEACCGGLLALRAWNNWVSSKTSNLSCSLGRSSSSVSNLNGSSATGSSPGS